MRIYMSNLFLNIVNHHHVNLLSVYPPAAQHRPSQRRSDSDEGLKSNLKKTPPTFRRFFKPSLRVVVAALQRCLVYVSAAWVFLNITIPTLNRGYLKI